MDLLIGELLADAAATVPTAVAATLGTRSLSYSELDAMANRMARRLLSAGVRRGQIVAWCAGPSLTTIGGFAAVARIGAVFAPINPSLGRGEVEPLLEYLHPHLVVADEERAELAPGAVLPQSLDADSASPVESPGALSDTDPHVVYLTSGTTGAPKGVVVSHRASWLRSFPGGSTFSTWLRREGGILPSFPLFHYGGWHYVLESWHHRTSLHLCARLDGEAVVSEAARWRPAAVYCIPAIWQRVLDASPTGAGLESVRRADTGTSAAPLELLLRIREAIPGATTSVLYGSSEGGHHSTLHDGDVLERPGSVGTVAPPGVIRLSEEGEILYRSPTLMDGYFERPDETRAAIRDGWYHTGDVGVIDDDGYLFITGRAKEVIRTGGETVAPAEVESALAGIPGIADLAVVGVPDERWGEIVCAVVVPSGAAAPGIADLRTWIGDRLAGFKHPRLVVAVDSIPRTPATGQVQRTLLREMAAQR